MQSRDSKALSRENSKKHELLQMGAFRNIKVVKELFLHYGENFIF